MRLFLLRTLFLCMPCCAIAQLEDGSFAPDFELQDLNGNTWHLYELLEEGKQFLVGHDIYFSFEFQGAKVKKKESGHSG